MKSKCRKIRINIKKNKEKDKLEECQIRITMGYKPQVLPYHKNIETLFGIYNPSTDNTYWD